MAGLFLAGVVAIFICISIIVSRISDALDCKKHIAEAKRKDLIAQEIKEAVSYEKRRIAETRAELEKERSELRRKAIDFANQERKKASAAQQEYHTALEALTNATNSVMLIPNYDSFATAFASERGYKALTEPMTFTKLKNFSCTVRTAAGSEYICSLTSCSCKDFQNRQHICKHMLALALRLHVLPFDAGKLIAAMQEDATRTKEQITAELQQARKPLTALLLKSSHAEKRNEFLMQQQATLEKHRDDMLMDFPWIAKLFTELEERYDTMRLTTLPKGAYKSAELVKELKSEKKELLLRAIRAEALLSTYEHLFPWLEEFRSVPLDEALAVVADTADNEDYDVQTRKWLSPEEYANLPTSEKYQRALTRYQNRHKTDWEIGIEYERYIGYLYEQEGYTVKYFGATEGLQDMGRDLIATKDNTSLIIQCKRWSENKTIHEKHIFQLYSTTLVMQLKDASRSYTPVFVTTAALSDLAAECAELLRIQVRYIPYAEHPLIKCNIGKDECGAPVKIYHLPFDQQYDRVIISPKNGETYAATVTEAEELGFRRAKRHYAE